MTADAHAFLKSEAGGRPQCPFPRGAIGRPARLFHGVGRSRPGPRDNGVRLSVRASVSLIA